MSHKHYVVFQVSIECGTIGHVWAYRIAHTREEAWLIIEEWTKPRTFANGGHDNRFYTEETYHELKIDDKEGWYCPRSMDFVYMDERSES